MKTIHSSAADVSLLKYIEEIQSFLAGNTWAKSGQDFFKVLAEFLAKSLETDCITLVRFMNDGNTVQTVVSYCDGKFEANTNYPLKDTPCQIIDADKVCIVKERVYHSFPKDRLLQKMKAESFAWITLWGKNGTPIGILSVADRQPLQDSTFTEIVLKLVSIRVAAELEQKQALEDLKNLQAWQNDILKSAMDGYWVTDLQGHFLEVNETYCRMSGYSRKELLQMKISDLECVESDLETQLHIQKLIEIGEDRFESKHYRKDGSIFDVEISTRYHSEYGGQFVAFLHDITNRKKAEEKLRASEDQFRNLVRDMAVGVLLQGPDTGMLLSNQMALNLLGLTDDQLMSRTSFDPEWNVIHEDGSDFPASTHPVSQAIALGRPVRNVVMGVYHPLSKDRIWLQVDANPQLSADGKVQQVICTFIDISQRKRAERDLSQLNEKLENIVQVRTLELMTSYSALHKAEEKYRTVANFTYDWETWIGTDGKFIYVSPSCQTITGYAPEEFFDDPNLFFEIVHPADKEIIEKHFHDELTGNVANWEQDFRIINRNGNEHWIGHRCLSIYDQKGNWLGQRGSNRDITRQKNTEFAMITSRQQLRALTRKMEAVAEEERIHIAREIHDELGHLLTALKYDIEGLSEKTDLYAAVLSSEMAALLSMVDVLIDSVRKISTELRPGILDHLGLFPAIEWQIRQFQMRTKFNCTCEIADKEVNFSKNETNIIYRILQEILTNVGRHSKARNLWVTIDKIDNLFTMKAVDDGVGFEWKDHFQLNSLGLMGMHERALSIGAELKIESEIGKGTSVTFLLDTKK